MPNSVFRVFLVDPDPVNRANLRSGLGREPAIRIIGEAGGHVRAVFLTAQLQPDIVLLNVALEREVRVPVTSRIRTVAPRARVLILADRNAGRDCIHAILAGARGVCLSTTPPAILAEAIRAIGRGETWVDTDMPLYGHARRTLRITPAERQMLKAISAGKTNQEIALDFGLSEQTIKNKLSLIYRKLQVSNRTEAVHRALQLDLIG